MLCTAIVLHQEKLAKEATTTHHRCGGANLWNRWRANNDQNIVCWLLRALSQTRYYFSHCRAKLQLWCCRWIFQSFYTNDQKVVRFAGTPPHTQRFVILLWFNTSTRCSHWGVVHAVDKRRTCCIHFVFIKLFRFVLSTALMSISSKCFHFARYFFSLSPTENLFLLLENKNIFRSLETGEWNRLYCCCRLLDGALFLLSSLFLGNVRCGLWAMGGARLNHTWETERLLRFSAYLKIPIWMAS